MTRFPLVFIHKDREDQICDKIKVQMLLDQTIKRQSGDGLKHNILRMDETASTSKDRISLLVSQVTTRHKPHDSSQASSKSFDVIQHAIERLSVTDLDDHRAPKMKQLCGVFADS